MTPRHPLAQWPDKWEHFATKFHSDALSCAITVNARTKKYETLREMTRPTVLTLYDEKACQSLEDFYLCCVEVF